MMKKKVLLVGEHPNSFTGNGHMMAEMIRHIDRDKFDFSVFAGTTGVIKNAFEPLDYPIIEGGYDDNDPFGGTSLVYVLSGLPDLDAVMFVGIDLWAYRLKFEEINNIRKSRKWKWVSLFPYDQIHIRQDWLDWLKYVDFPCVYSQYGYDLLKDHVKNLRYHRPYLYDSEMWECYPEEKRRAQRQKLFNMSGKDDFIFGFFGNNQVRKDPQRLIHAFFRLKQERNLTKNIVLYLHTTIIGGWYNIEQYIRDCGSKLGDIFIMKQGFRYDTKTMVDVYNSVDCYITPSLQEGLNWTVVESMLCGTPVIASDTTAHRELIADGAGIPIPCTDLAFTPVECEKGSSWVETRACNVTTMMDIMQNVVEDNELRIRLKDKGLSRGKEWLAGVSDINELLTEVTRKKFHIVSKKRKILFAQHSSAGDVLMTTQCFKGLKERHKGMPLVYMTQNKFRDIVINNPYIDEFVDWDEDLFTEYDVFYNPHGNRILPGGFNSLDNTLYSLYPYFCKVKADKMFIDCVKPSITLPDQYIVVHTTGGDPTYRTYPHMDVVIKLLGLPAVQIGGPIDRACNLATLDLRGELSFRETAYVMKHAKAAVVIDSFPSHLAGCLGTPAVVLYGPAPARVVRPRDDNNVIVNIEPNRLDVCVSLTACWGRSERGACNKPCINTINPSQIVSTIKRIMR